MERPLAFIIAVFLTNYLSYDRNLGWRVSTKVIICCMLKIDITEGVADGASITTENATSENAADTANGARYAA
jgi:hypothetical protein